MSMANTTVRFLHTSDWQLGMTRHFLEGEAQGRYGQARLDAVRAIADLARERHCDFIVVAGDVFDSNLVSSQVVRRAFDALTEIDVPVYLLPGNHDALNAASVYRNDVFRAECPCHVHVLDQPRAWPVAPGVEIIAAPLTSNSPIADPTDAVLSDLPADGTRRILLAHGQIDQIDPDARSVSAIRLAPLEAALREGRLHYVALGDRHSRLSVGHTGAVHYSGTPEVTSFREEFPGDVLIVELPPDRPAHVDAVHIGRWHFVTLEADVSTAADVTDLDRRLGELPDPERTVVNHILTGTLSLSDHAALEEILERHTDRLASCRAWQRHTRIAVHVDGAELSDLGVGGYVADAAADLAARAARDTDRNLPTGTTSDSEAPTATDALALLYRLVTVGAR
ncbi:3',5'-cyclic adenosine monophosphate phosphodiesterase CpdA [Austwickia sp. TVS 96-490-7B]|uniref:metallophosphoesterase family protein n=1 Tax=Austwickia sp. TVS 96-490-7B TaxID=2830843 RepID=UPI001D3DD0C4|nr:DNA repair exonuclease [Austwickia sp. TVS 96-490-7B]MBW3085548.1 3',5'-cyclic adenosine monophosphate phosphodiesterase CpdA [Austwickia sp. TVS 96-490-7B]